MTVGKLERRAIEGPRKKGQFRKTWDCYAMIAPFVLLFSFFIILPILSSIILGFTYFNMVSTPRFIGLMNFSRLFLDDDVFIKTLSNTLVFAFITGPISYFACLLFAWLINELPPKVRSVMTFVFYAPNITGNLFVMWSFIFSGDSVGMVNSTLMNLGFINEPVQWLTDARYSLTIIMIVQIWLCLGASFLSFIAGMQSIDRSMYEAGAIDGVRNRWQELFYITLPSMGPQLLFGAVMQIGASFSVSNVVTTLAGSPTTDYSADTIVTYIMDVGNTRYEMGYASAISVILFLIMIVTNIATNGLIRHVASTD